MMLGETTQIDQLSYRLLVESVKDYAIFMIDTSGHVVSWNAGAEHIKGYMANEIMGRHISVFYSREDSENHIPEMNLGKAREYGRYETEGWRIRKDGSAFWADVVFTALKDADGEIIGFGKVTRDMSRRKRWEEEFMRLNEELENQLKKSKSEILDYKHALDESAIVAITDQKGIIRHVNDNFCKISKFSESELLGMDHRIINSGHHSKEFIRDLWVTISNGRIWRGELKNRAKDGSYYWVDTTIVPFLNEYRKPYRYLAIRSDITQRKMAEEQIIRINEDLERKIKERTLELTEALEREKELNELKSRFVSMASHEFRTPLSAILSSISLIDMYASPGQEDKRHKHVDRIKSSVKNLTDILEDFLSLERLEKGRMDVKPENFDLAAFIEDIMAEMDGMMKPKQQQIIHRNSEPLDICQDKKILKNVLLNLLSNAVKYSPDGSEIYISTWSTDQTVLVSIKDQGIGIPASSQKDLFTKFFRADNAAHIQGTGLGLNIVKKYVELMEGDIHFSSKENKGSTFTIEIPKNVNG